MRAGPLNRRVKLQSRVKSKDGAGQPKPRWTTLAVVWANISCSSGMGAITRMQENVPVSAEKYSIRIRFRDGVTAGMRVLYGDQAFDIGQVRMDFTGREWTDLICELGANDG